jgi:hypothetical protein
MYINQTANKHVNCLIHRLIVMEPDIIPKQYRWLTL